MEFEIDILSTDTTGLPDGLAKKLNKNIAYGGGGARTSTTSLDPDIKKAVLPGIKDVANIYKEGGFGKVAGTEGVESALDKGQDTSQQLRDVGAAQIDAGKAIANQEGRYGEGIAETRALGQGLVDGTNPGAQRALQNLQGNLQAQAANSGSLTSARGQAATQGALLDRSLQHQQQGASILSGLGDRAVSSTQAGSQLQNQAGQNIAAADEANLRAEQARRGLDQEKLDAPYKAASQYFGLLQGAPQGSTTTQTGGGK